MVFGGLGVLIASYIAQENAKQPLESVSFGFTQNGNLGLQKTWQF